uniref:GTP diphosphokinase n=1 Tax=Fagus sylvatica TaxID=28930 RepID=A0A2N9H7I3_FAGSY
MLEGVDVTGCPIFSDAKVQKAVAFAKKAHHGQLRKTGDPYLTHCIHTGRILAMLVPSSGKRAVDTVVAGILHDVIDDTYESLHNIEEEFGDDVAKLVAGVSKLSYINQLLRRNRRINVNPGTLGPEEANNLRVMLLGMVDDPRVVLIKLADRLHNMRTIYVLPLPKAQAVAKETLVIWCSLASRLGLWALKAELEDLCFAVLQPQVFRKMRADLASMWSPSSRAGNPRRISARASLLPLDEKSLASEVEGPMAIDEDITSLKDLLEAVVPFDILLDRRKRTKFLNSLRSTLETHTKPKVLRDAGIALASLVVCEEALERELIISSSYVPGMEVTLSSRLKSLYGIYSKMKRKDVSISKVYDARALRVVVGDKNGTLRGPAVQCCYSLLNILHKFIRNFHDWELEGVESVMDYLYSQISLLGGADCMSWGLNSTGVQGPDSSPLEVQIRTQRMHEYAEHGLAAHWLYKETGNKLSSISSMDESEIEASSYISKDMDDQSSIVDDLFLKYSSLKVGHPVLRVEGSHLLAAVIIRVDNGGRELLVAVSFVLPASEAVADRRSSFQRKRWEAYASKTNLGAYCQPFIQVIDLTEQEESEYWAVISAVFEGRQVRLLRTMLQWEQQLRSEASLGQPKQGGKPYVNPGSVVLGEVVILCWPHGGIMRLRTGSTADAARRVG